MDLDFERAVRPPPAPSEAATVSLEDLIRRRVAERQWDDPPKLLLPAPEKKRREVELDDKKSVKACLPRDGSAVPPTQFWLRYCFVRLDRAALSWTALIYACFACTQIVV